MINPMLLRKRHLGIGAIHGAGRGVDQMLHAVAAASFDDLQETHHIAMHIGMRILNRVTHAGLCA